jgi:hypothetical protein
MLINIGWQSSLDVIQSARLDNMSEMWQKRITFLTFIPIPQFPRRDRFV